MKVMQWVKNICRLCGQVEDNPYNIFNSDGNLAENIKKCLNFEIYKEDFKPKQVCQLCYNNLNEFSKFIDICYATNLKFESIYYTEPWHHIHKSLCEHTNNPKQSVIVSNRQNHDYNASHCQSNSAESMTTLTTLPNYTINSSENLLGFSVNYDIESDDIQSCLIACDTFDKQENITTAKEIDEYDEENENTINPCLMDESLDENGPTALLDSVANVSNTIDNGGPCESLKNVLVSVEDVRDSLGDSINTDNFINTSDTIMKIKKPYACPHCEKSFIRRSNLNAHISIHTNIKPYKCSNCQKTFAVKCHLTQHKKVHLDIFVCQICHKKFDVPSKLSRHIQIHSDDRPFACSFANCTKSFSDKNNLRQHTLLHSLEKNFCCVICKKEFKTKKNLKAHVTRHVNNGTFQCKVCQKSFKHKHNFKKHLIKHTNKAETKIS